MSGCSDTMDRAARRARTRTGRMIRTGISGLAATVVDVAVLVVLVEIVAAPLPLAAFVSALCGAFGNFTISKYWAFRCPDPIDPKQVGSYAIVSLGTALFMAWSIHLLANLGVAYLIAKGIAATFVFLAWSYPAQSRVVFRAAPRA